MRPPTDAEDAAHLARLRAGDESAFDAIFRAHYPSLVGLAESLLRERAPAEDVAQDVLLELWRRRESLVVTDTVRGYLYRSVRNRALNELRRHRVAQAKAPLVRGEDAVTPLATAAIEEAELEAAITGVLAALPGPVRETFVLSREGGLRYAEIAAQLGISVKTVEARMGRALKAMRERLTPWLEPGG